MIKIIYEQKENRAAAYDDEKFIGESTYAKSDKVWIIDHTFVEKSYDRMVAVRAYPFIILLVLARFIKKIFKKYME